MRVCVYAYIMYVHCVHFTQQFLKYLIVEIIIAIGNEYIQMYIEKHKV